MVDEMVGDKIASQEQRKIVLLWVSSKILIADTHKIQTAMKKIERAGEKVPTTVWLWWWLGSMVSMFRFIALSSSVLDRGTCPSMSVLGHCWAFFVSFFDPPVLKNIFYSLALGL